MKELDLTNDLKRLREIISSVDSKKNKLEDLGAINETQLYILDDIIGSMEDAENDLSVYTGDIKYD